MDELKFVDYVTIAKSLISCLDLDDLILDRSGFDSDKISLSEQNYDRISALSNVLICLYKFRSFPF